MSRRACHPASAWRDYDRQLSASMHELQHYETQPYDRGAEAHRSRSEGSCLASSERSTRRVEDSSHRTGMLGDWPVVRARGRMALHDLSRALRRGSASIVAGARGGWARFVARTGTVTACVDKSRRAEQRSLEVVGRAGWNDCDSTCRARVAGCGSTCRAEPNRQGSSRALGRGSASLVARGSRWHRTTWLSLSLSMGWDRPVAMRGRGTTWAGMSRRVELGFARRVDLTWNGIDRRTGSRRHGSTSRVVRNRRRPGRSVAMVGARSTRGELGMSRRAVRERLA